MALKALLISLLATLVAGRSVNDRLTQPPLHSNLDYCEEGLKQNLPLTPYTLSKWNNDLIPQECKTVVTGGVYSNVVYDPNDFDIYEVTYSDCASPWVFCHHRGSNITIDSMASQFSRLPIQMRSWVKHVVDVPENNGWAFEWDGVITFVRPIDEMITTIIHETGHSLDLNGAFSPDKPLSGSAKWWSELDQDPNVPDPYAQSNTVEDIAQSVVIATFNENVPGKFESIEPNYQNVFHQMATIITEARDGGNGNSIIVPGESSTCTHRVQASNPVPKSNSAKMTRGDYPEMKLAPGIKAIDISFRKGGAKHSNCTLAF